MSLGMTLRCKHTIYPKGEGHVRVAAGKVWPRRRQCLRKANESGYCTWHEHFASVDSRAQERKS